jgi:hypothetical protein
MSGGIGCRLASSGFGLVAMHVERSMRIKRSVATGSVASGSAAGSGSVSAVGSAGGRSGAARESGHRLRRRSRSARRGAGGHRLAEPRSLPVRTLEEAEVDSPFDLSWSLDGTGPWREG